MHLHLQPHNKNLHPLGGVLVRGNSPMHWLAEMQRMGLPVTASVYPVPGIEANSVYGCVVVCNAHSIKDFGANMPLQLAGGNVFIPVHARLFPEVTETEWQKLFGESPYVYLPEIGLAELEEAIRWDRLLLQPFPRRATIVQPNKGVYIPKDVGSVSIEAPEASEPENPFTAEGQEKLPFNIQKLMKGNHKEMEKFLKYMETNPEAAMKFALPLDELGRGAGNGYGRFAFSKQRRSEFWQSEAGVLLKVLFFVVIGIVILAFIIKVLSGNGLSGSFPILLIVMLSRFLYQVFKGELNTGGAGGSNSGGRLVLLDNDRYAELRDKYNKAAEKYIENGEYEKAAYIYHKLLKNHAKAASVLEEGKLYEPAAGMYLKYCKDKPGAARCYEEGRMYNRCLPLYKELAMNEKVGDIYTKLNDQENAKKYYNLVLDEYLQASQYLKAYQLVTDKMGDLHLGRTYLLQAWQKNIMAFDCMDTYLRSFTDAAEMETEAVKIYNNLVTETNDLVYLRVVTGIYKTNSATQAELRNVAYTIIGRHIHHSPQLAGNLVALNEKDTALHKDVMRYRTISRKKGFV